MKDWQITATCGGRFPACEPVFFNDKQRVAVPTALAIKIYQLSTKQMVSKISIDCLEASQLFLADNEEHFYVIQNTGNVEKIGLDVSDPLKMETQGLKIYRILNQISSSQFFVIAVNTRGLFEIGKIDFSDGKFESYLELTTHVDTGFVSVSPSSLYAAFASSKSNKIEVVDLVTSNKTERFGANKSAASCVAVGDSGIVAMGTTSGVIDLLYENSNSTRALKWHLEPVLSLKFTLNDTYLLSGGHERVLVFWQLATNEQQFLPRLADDITNISMNASGSLYGVLLGTNSQLVVISAVDLVSRLQVAGTNATFNEHPLEPQQARRKRRRKDLDLWANSDFTTPLAVQPGTKNVYLKCAAAQTQVYNLSRDEQECVLNLAQLSDIGKVRKELEIQDPDVLMLKFTPDGEHIITTDQSSNPPGLLSSEEVEVNLKFWSLNKETGAWQLATRVVSPHGKGVSVSDICFVQNQCVTAGSDGSLRLWSELDVNENGLKEFGLRKSMTNFNNQTPAVSLSASVDGSLIALSYDEKILIIDFAKFKVVFQLPNLVDQPIRCVKFVGSSLAILSMDRLTIFDLVTMSEVWSIALKTPENGDRLLAVDAVKGVIALVVNFWDQYKVKSLVLKFGTDRPIPKDFFLHNSAIGAISHIPGTSSFCFIDLKSVLNVVSGKVDAIAAADTVKGTNIVSFDSNSQEPTDEMEVDGYTKSLDVNSVSKIFETGGSIEQLFDRVVSMLS